MLKEQIEYYLDGKKLGAFLLPQGSTEKTRYQIAVRHGITNYDRYVFTTDGEHRFDSINASGYSLPPHTEIKGSVCQQWYDENNIPIKMLWQKKIQ
jgi:hypothetical protein